MIRKIRLISKFITSQPGKQTIVIHVVLNILRNKDNQVMKFGQLKEYNMESIFLKKSYTKDGGETSPEKLKLRISLDQKFKFLFSLFYWITTTIY